MLLHELGWPYGPITTTHLAAFDPSEERPDPAGSPAPRPPRPAGLPRKRHTPLAALSVLLLAAIGAAGVVASGAMRDHTSAGGPTALTTGATTAHPALAHHLPAGPRWTTTQKLSTSKGVFTLGIHAVVTATATTTPDTGHATKVHITVPQIGGYYTVTNDGSEPYALAEPVRLFAYWKVPIGLCRRWDPYWVPDLTANHIPITPVGHGQELCPMAWGDSTLDTTPQTLQPGAPADIPILPTTLGVLGQDYPLEVSKADGAIVAHTTAKPPAGWLALDEELSSDSDNAVASTGLDRP